MSLATGIGARQHEYVAGRFTFDTLSATSLHWWVRTGTGYTFRSSISNERKLGNLIELENRIVSFISFFLVLR